MAEELRIRTADGAVQSLPLGQAPLTLGRSRTCALYFPNDHDLSRQHLRLEPTPEGWVLEDLNSKNGTRLNGLKVTARVVLQPGDTVEAGHLMIEYADSEKAAPPARVVLDDDPSTGPNATTVVAKLSELLDTESPAAETLGGRKHVRALIHAGRELAGHRPLGELFELILGLALEAVGCVRGLLLTLERNGLTVRAARGDGFRLSTAVRDRVMEHKESLLVLDTLLDEELRSRMSIMEQQVRSMMAVPLQTNERVIGMIYVDSQHCVRQFTREELNLLTVLANVAAIRIEHARLAEVEQQERMLAKEMEQAAEIQRALLPERAPQLPGLELAGFNEPCHMVGGDYYDFFVSPRGCVMTLVGDVAGKGMAAAMLMSNLQARVQLLSEECCEIALLVTRLNRAIALNCPANRFITLFACAVHPESGEVVYCNAGHNPPLLARAGGQIEVLEGGGLVLGVLPEAEYEESRCQMEPGDTLLLYSDGITEALREGDEEEDEFGQERLAVVLAEHRHSTAGELIEAIRKAVAEFTCGAHARDDVTMVAVRRV